MLSAISLASKNRITNAAVLLFGKDSTLARVVPDAEIIFEWRNDEADIAYGIRRNWRSSFILAEKEIWQAIDERNTMFRYQEGFVQRDIPAFNEDSVREAVVNAFVHRAYDITGRSVLIKASPQALTIENPGRLMPGITLDNILDETAWRNRLLAESLEKVNIMERSSQGIDKIFRQTIESGKGAPTIALSNVPTVMLHIPAALKDQGFINFLETVVKKTGTSFSVREIIELETLREQRKNSAPKFKEKFLELGIIERIGSGKGSKYILSHQYYKYAHDPGRYTRLTGLSRDVKRNIIMEHLKNNKKVTNHELQLAMPDMQTQEITNLLKGMKRDKLIEHQGSARWGHWQIIDDQA